MATSIPTSEPVQRPPRGALVEQPWAAAAFGTLAVGAALAVVCRRSGG